MAQVLSGADLYAMISGLGDSFSQGRKRALEERALNDEAESGDIMGAWIDAAAGGAAPKAAPISGKLPTFAGGNGRAELPADPEIEKRFIGALRDGGLTNPAGLAAFAAYANAESRYSPKNITGSWSDPSESGQPGTSGGILSWRGDRFANMRRATAGAEDPVVAQAKFALTENPELTVALQNAKTPEEAHGILANAWKFAGYDRPGGENDRRLGLTRSYLAKVGPADMPAADATPVNAPGFQVPGGAAPAAGEPGRVGRFNPTQVEVLKRMHGNRVLRPLAQSIIAKQLEPKDVWRDEVGADGSISQRNLITNERKQIQAAKDKFRTEVGPDGRTYQVNDNTNQRTVLVDVDKPPAAIAEAQAVLKGPPELRDAVIQLKQAGAKTGDDSFEQSFGKESGERWSKILGAGAAANAKLADIGRMREISNAGGDTGHISTLKGLLAPWAAAVGVDIGDVASVQELDSITQRLAPQMRVAGSGSTSDIEFRGMVRAMPGLWQNPAARDAILNSFEAAARHEMAAADIATDLAEKKISRGEAERRLRDMPDPMSSFKQFRTANPELFGKKGDAAAAGSRQPSQIEEVAAAAKKATTPAQGEERKPLPNGYTAARAKADAIRALKSLGDTPDDKAKGEAIKQRLLGWGIGVEGL